VPVPDPGPDSPPLPSATHAELAEALLASCSSPEVELQSAIEALGTRDDFPMAVLDALVERGLCELPVEESPTLRLYDLVGAPSTKAWRTHLDRLSLIQQGPLRRFRIGRLYDVIGEVEKAASNYRILLMRPEPLSLSLAAEFAHAAALGGQPGLALAAVDRVAEDLGRRADLPSSYRDPVREDPLALTAVLERAQEAALLADSAPRAAALARTSVGLLERMALRQETRRALLGAVKSLRAAEQADLALGFAKRLRTAAQRAASAVDEAGALGQVAEQMLQEGEPKRALALFRQSAEVLEEGGHLTQAMTHRLAAAELLASEGKLEQARKEVAGLLDRAREAKDMYLGLTLLEEEAGMALRLGKVAAVLSSAEVLRKGWEAQGEPARAAAAVVLLSQALLLGGDKERAWKALGRVVHQIRDPFTAASSLRVRAELLEVDGRSQEARLILADAARDFARADGTVWECECWLRRAELALDNDNPSDASQDLARVQERSAAVGSRFELRYELCRARMAEDPDERELLVDELYERALVEGHIRDRVLASVAKAKAQRSVGDPAGALEALKPVLTSLVELRSELPAGLRKGFRASPLGRAAMLLAEELSSELAE
jgi:tetratricopeptide (TPR) repeat protein